MRASNVHSVVSRSYQPAFRSKPRWPFLPTRPQTVERTLRSAYPHIAVLGEEGVLGDPEADQRWVVDPIDGTVNFAYGIPHACVSIALRSTSSCAVSAARIPSASASHRRVEPSMSVNRKVTTPEGAAAANTVT